MFATKWRRAAARTLGDYMPPPLQHVDDLLSELRSAECQTQQAGEWNAFTADITAALREGPLNAFLRLRPIANTVHPSMARYCRAYLSHVLASRLRPFGLQESLTESPIGRPLIHPYYPFSSPLLVQQAYHVIRLCEATGLDLLQLSLVVDYGGGYGSFYRLMRNLGYRNQYLICDLPVMSAMQRFYLRNLFPTGEAAHPPENLRWLSGEDVGDRLALETKKVRPSLLVATWSLSETPMEVRERIAPAISGFDYALFAYQAAFSGVDNRAYFAGIEARLTSHRWQHFECPVLRGNHYLIGHRL